MDALGKFGEYSRSYSCSRLSPRALLPLLSCSPNSPRASIKVRIHGAILRAMLRAMAELHRVSTPKFVARNIARNIAAVESRPTSATLRATNFFVYPLSAAFRAIV